MYTCVFVHYRCFLNFIGATQRAKLIANFMIRVRVMSWKWRVREEPLAPRRTRPVSAIVFTRDSRLPGSRGFPVPRVSNKHETRDGNREQRVGRNAHGSSGTPGARRAATIAQRPEIARGLRCDAIDIEPTENPSEIRLARYFYVFFLGFFFRGREQPASGEKESETTPATCVYFIVSLANSRALGGEPWSIITVRRWGYRMIQKSVDYRRWSDRLRYGVSIVSKVQLRKQFFFI